MQEMMLAKAKELLQSGAVQRVLGWQTGEFVYDITPAVFTSAEEMAYPQAQEPELAAKLDEIARRNGVTVLGTGINPGLIMDLLVILWTGACESVDHIVSRRVNSLSPFGPAVMEEQDY